MCGTISSPLPLGEGSGVRLPQASKVLPTILSCRQICPACNLPSAIRQAILALVPVPHGERSYALPGQSTKFRLWAAGSRGGPNSSRSEEHTSELQSLRHLVC